jgi:hypothetical protein
MDEFSWFIGLFEGEGCYFLDGGKGVLEISMTDEDTIARAAKFLGSSYKEIKVKENRKPMWKVRVRGGMKRGRYYDLIIKMLPYLSKRRQENIKKVLSLNI